MPSSSSKFVARAVQLGAHFLAIVFAMSTFIPLGQIFYKYDYRCILNSRLDVVVSVNGSKTSVNIQGESSRWGDRGICYYTIFLSVFVSIHAFIWGWFYIHLIRTLRESGREMTLFLPSFFTHAILFVCSFVSSIMLSLNANNLCNTLRMTPAKTYSCSELSGMVWHSDLDPSKDSVSPFGRLAVAQISSWVSTILVAVPCGVAIYHLIITAPVVYIASNTPKRKGINGPCLDDSSVTMNYEDDLISLNSNA